MQAGVRLNKIEVVGQQADGADAPSITVKRAPVLCEDTDLSKFPSLRQTTEKTDHVAPVLLLDRIAEPVCGDGRALPFRY